MTPWSRQTRLKSLRAFYDYVQGVLQGINILQKDSKKKYKKKVVLEFVIFHKKVVLNSRQRTKICYAFFAILESGESV